MRDTPPENHRDLVSLLAVCLAWLSTPTLADDVEIFISTDGQEISCPAPNVLFIIDTSGSMDADVDTQNPWDPDITYEGCFDSTRIYYNETGTTPDCNHQFTFAKADLFCQAATAGTEYTGLFQAWNPDLETWVKIPDTNDDFFIECAADEGIHGNGSSGSIYAVDGPDGPWSAAEDERIAWGANASAVTLFDGNWLNWQTNPPVFTRSRLDVVKEVVTNTLDNMGDVNVGLMEFNPTEGGPVIAAVNNLEASKVDLITTIDGLEPGGSTPLSETLYEAGQYLAGRLVDYGDVDNDNRSVAESRVGGKIGNKGKDRYLSPLVGSGQNNYIVLLTDGEPSDDTSANRKIEALPGYGEAVGEACNDTIEGDCLDKMAQYLNRADLRDDLDGLQNVITHTIGFATDFELLKSTAERGGGKYFVADDTTTLTRVLANLVKDFSRQASLLTPPTVPINVFNRSSQLNEVYLSLFLPASTTHWPGNLKKYQLIEGANGQTLADANGRPVLTQNNLIDSSAISLWSKEADGGDVRLGGAASLLLDPGNRFILTNASGGTALVHIRNDSITAAMLGAPEDQRDTVIDWALGFDVRDTNGDGSMTDPRLSMGDPLHVQPVVGEYGGVNRNAIVFIATNDGYLHAFNAQTGQELWAFIPQRLLKRLYALSLDEPAQNKQYGLDGELVLVTDDNGRPEALLFGMRRGGEALFSMDISNPNAQPKLNWIIDSQDPDFLDMGQTWSPPVIAEMNIGAHSGPVAIFGGGYDPGQDNRVHRTDTKGNAIYIVALDTGKRLWSAGSKDTARGNHDLELDRMKYSIPAGIRVLDQSGDDRADRLYVGDMGGQIWQFDLPDSGGSEGGVMASLGAADLESPSTADVRRFYNTPDAVNVSITGQSPFLAINIGSGYRAHPLDTGTDDEFYSIRLSHPLQVVATEEYGTDLFPLLKREDLVDITSNTAPVLETSDAGWRLGMVQDSGEKILGESLTVDNVVFFNSFSPVGSAQSCLPGAGLNRSYRISIFSGNPLTNLDDSLDTNELTPRDRFVEGSIGVPISDPALRIGPGTEAEVCSGLECFGQEDTAAFTPELVNKTYWYPVQSP